MTLEEKAKLVVGHLPYQGKIGQKPDFDYPGTGMPIGASLTGRASNYLQRWVVWCKKIHKDE